MSAEFNSCFDCIYDKRGEKDYPCCDCIHNAVDKYVPKAKFKPGDIVTFDDDTNAIVLICNGGEHSSIFVYTDLGCIEEVSTDEITYTYEHINYIDDFFDALDAILNGDK